jgi:hypothetical protein
MSKTGKRLISAAKEAVIIAPYVARIERLERALREIGGRPNGS